MITKTENGYAVVVETAGNPAEEYVCAMQNIVDSVQAQNPDFIDSNFYLLELLKSMLPTIEQATTMLDFSKKLDEAYTEDCDCRKVVNFNARH